MDFIIAIEKLGRANRSGVLFRSDLPWLIQVPTRVFLPSGVRTFFPENKNNVIFDWYSWRETETAMMGKEMQAAISSKK
ncbi:MAG: hypothetical protein OSA89_13620 [Mariniblastus sp.]|nr:hypothetical protein [Mariniblastus sp.]